MRKFTIKAKLLMVSFVIGITLIITCIYILFSLSGIREMATTAQPNELGGIISGLVVRVISGVIFFFFLLLGLVFGINYLINKSIEQSIRGLKVTIETIS